MNRGGKNRGYSQRGRWRGRGSMFCSSFSEYNNEPAFERSFDLGGFTGAMKVGGIAKYSTSACGLGDVVDIIYDQLCAIDRNFTRSVSRIMFEYYGTQLYYMRIAQIERNNGNDDIEVGYMADVATQTRWHVPKLLSDYLGCIGNFKDSGGLIAEHVELALPNSERINGIRGYFGRVNAVTHIHYENRPSPGVISQRLCEDIRYTAFPDIGPEWDLPGDISPTEPNAGRPTANTLGWMPASRLTDEQESGLLSCGISVNDAVNIFPGQWKFNFCRNLMVYIDGRLTGLSGRLKLGVGLSQSLRGSMCQQDYTRIIPELNLEPLPIDRYGKNSVKLEGFAKLDQRQDLFSQTMRFRCYRETIENGKGEQLDSWCCYRFRDYTQVPHQWLDTRNEYYNYGKTVWKVWNIGQFSSAGLCPRQVLKVMNGQNLTSAPVK